MGKYTVNGVGERVGAKLQSIAAAKIVLVELAINSN